MLTSLKATAAILAVALVVGPVSVATASAAPEVVAQAGASQTNGTVTGKVTESNGAPLAGAVVTARGPVTVTATTGPDGSYTLSLPPGVYSVTATRSGFETATQVDYAVLSGQSGNLSVSLSPATLSSLREIGRVSVNRGRSRFNAGPASIATISNEQFADQGQVQVQRILDQTPGIVIDHPGTSVNNASPGAISFPSIRGGLGFETASLIDGHPLAVQTFGDYVTTFLSTDVLSGAELIKGPGAAAPEINYAINGTINFRTLDPTSRPSGQIKLGTDSYGGVNSNVRYSNTFSNKLGIVLDYSQFGTPGPLHDAPNNLTIGSGWLFNCPVAGAPTCQAQVGFTTNPIAGAANTAQNAPQIGTATAIACCGQVNTNYYSRTELAKLRYNFSPVTTATVSYLGSQTYTDQNGNHVYNFGTQFTPGAGYTGPITAGSTVNTFQNVFLPNDFEINNEPIFQAEVRTSIGRDTVLGRYYAGSINRLQYQIIGKNVYPNDFENFTVNGTVGLCPGTYTVGTGANAGKCVSVGGATVVAPTPTVFNNRAVTMELPQQAFVSTEEDQLHGGTFEYDHYLGSNGSVISLAADQVSGISDSYSISGTGAPSFSIYGGSKVRYTTVLLRGIFQLTPQVNLTLSNYFDNYYQKYTTDGGLTFPTVSYSRYDPRVGLVIRPNPNISIRASAGAGVAPPYLALLESRAPTPTYNTSTQIATETVNNGLLKPETSFGYDIGGDFRVSSDGLTVLTFDAYRNNLFNQFIGSVTQQQGTVQVCNANAGGPPPCAAGVSTITAPLYVTGSQNLDNARYEGVELGIRRDPPVGFGFTAQGALIRAYPVGLNNCIYYSGAAVAAGCTGTATTNLAIVPGANFYGSGTGGVGSFNAVNNHSIPYSQGYAEVRFRSPKGGLVSFGEQYYGPNNSLNLPAFFVANATARVPLFGDSKMTFQMAIDNLFNVYSNSFDQEFGGVGIPLVNGKIGLTNAGTIGPRVFRFSLTRNFGGS